MKDKIVFLNLRPQSNRYRFYGLFASPFGNGCVKWETNPWFILEDLENGLYKKEAKTVMKRAGIKKKVVDWILSVCKRNYKYE